MARTARIKRDGDAYYHVMSRITGKAFLLANPAVKREMLDCLERAAAFSGVRVGAFCIMDNHFHIVIFVPYRDVGTVTVDEVLERYAALRGDEAAEKLRLKLVMLLERGETAAYEAALDRLRVRMHDLSQFVKTFKEMFGQRFRRLHPHAGTIWAERFTSVLLENERYLDVCRRYVELNPVRAGIVRHAADYGWSTVGMARGGDAFAKACRDWMAVVFSGDSPRDEWMARRCPQIGAGRLLGSREFVEDGLRRYGDRLKSGRLAARLAREGVYASHGYRLDAKAA